jgi:tetratricopeptide (TPR) repeat protein
MPTLTLCAIVRNEAPNIARMLASVQGLVDDVVLLDTGSEDDTVGIARAMGATVHETTWPGSFSAARNQAIELCTGDWIISLDGDEALETADHAEVRRCIARPDAQVYMVELVNYLAGGQTNRFHYPRLYRRDPHIRYAGKVHNQLIHPYRAEMAAVRIYHWGYLRSGEARLRRLQQTFALCQEMVAEAPKDPGSHYYLAQTQFQLGDYTAAVANSRKVLAMLPNGFPPPGSYLGDTYFKLAYHAFLSGTYAEAEQWIQDGLHHGGNQVDLNFLGGRTMRALQRHDAAVTYWQSYLAALSARQNGDRRDIGMSTHFDGPDNLHEAWQGLATAISQLGGPAAVAPVLAEWRSVLPDDPEPLTQQLWLDLRQDRPGEAFARYQARPATMAPSDWLEATGMLAALNSRQPGAEAKARQFVTQPPARWLLHEYLARWLGLQGRLAEAATVIAAWRRSLPGDPRATVLEAELKLPSAAPGLRPIAEKVLAALVASARQAMQSGQWQATTADGLYRQAETAGDPVSALWAAGEAWALEPENPVFRDRYLALRAPGLAEAGVRWLIEGPPDERSVIQLREALAQRGLRTVRWDHPLAEGEAALILAVADAEQRRRWLEVLPADWPLAVAVDPRTPAGWAQAAACLAQGHVALPMLSTHAIPGTMDSPDQSVRRWQLMAADVLAPLRASGHLPLPILIQPAAEAHSDLAAAALRSLGAAGCVYPGQVIGDSPFWLTTTGLHQPARTTTAPWPWVFPMAGQWLSGAPARMVGPTPAPETVFIAGRSCKIQVTDTGWSVKLPDVGPGWHEVTANLPTGSISWSFGWSPLPSP